MSIVLKCKMCGGDLFIQEGSKTAVCDYCGTAQTILKWTNIHINEAVKNL